MDGSRKNGGCALGDGVGEGGKEDHVGVARGLGARVTGSKNHTNVVNDWATFKVR